MGDDVIASERLLEIHLKTYETMGPNIAVQGGVRLASSVPMTRFVRYLDKRSAAQFQLGNARPGDVLPFFSFYTCNCSVPRELVEACGGFPQDVVYYDDTFLGWMLERKGIPIIYEPLAEVQHDHAQTLDEFLLRQRQAGKDAAILAARHSELRKPLRVDQAALFEGNVWEIAKKVVKMLLFNRWTVRILKDFDLVGRLLGGINREAVMVNRNERKNITTTINNTIKNALHFLTGLSSDSLSGCRGH